MGRFSAISNLLSIDFSNLASAFTLLGFHLLLQIKLTLRRRPRTGGIIGTMRIVRDSLTYIHIWSVPSE